MDTITIRPVEGRSLPLENNPRRRVVEEMTVPDTEYYRRALACGDIVRVERAEAGGA